MGSSSSSAWVARARRQKCPSKRQPQAGHDADRDGPTRASEGQVQPAANAGLQPCGLSGGNSAGNEVSRGGGGTQVLSCASLSCACNSFIRAIGEAPLCSRVGVSSAFHSRPLWVIPPLSTLAGESHGHIYINFKFRLLWGMKTDVLYVCRGWVKEC